MDEATEKLVDSYDSAPCYPRNLIRPETFLHTQVSFANRLAEHQDRLFDGEEHASLDLLEATEWKNGFEQHVLRNLNDVHQKLWKQGYENPVEDPRFRIFFVRAPDSRSKLYTTKDMLVHVLTYHQAFVDFLDFVFSFGRQLYPTDTISGFRSQTSIDPQDRGFQIPQLARSGRGFQQCYSLKSVEPSRGTQSWPWSVRQSSVYHSFDLENGRASWVIVKGSTLMRDRISSSLREAPFSLNDPGSDALLMTLEAHLILCAWADEHWRWYMNYIDEDLNNTSRPLLSIKVESAPEMPRRLTRAATWLSEKESKSSPSTSLSKVLSEKIKKLMPQPTSQSPQDDDIALGQYTSGTQSGSPTGTDIPFRFKDVQRMQFIEENAYGARLVLSSDLETILALKNHYVNMWDCPNFPSSLRDDCKTGFKRFRGRLEAITESLKMHRSRIEAILQLIADRKALLNNVFTYRDIQASQASAREMEDMTAVTYQIALKTEKETVAMKLITLVTLLFLPATFISTFMSTDIIKYTTDEQSSPDSRPPHKVFSLGALQLFLALSIPLMLITLLGWCLWNRRMEFRLRKRHAEWAEQHLRDEIALTV